MGNKEYKIMAIPRSGHHGIMFWIMAGLDGTVCYRHNVSRKSDWKTRPRIITKMGSYCEKQHKERFKALHTVSEGVCSDNYVYNLEWKYSDSFSFNHGKTFHIYILRNIFNHLASFMKARKEKDQAYNSIMNRFFETYESFYSMAKSNSNTIIVRYDDWLSNKKYRESISSVLDMNNSDSGFKFPSTFSSWEGMDYDKQKESLKRNDQLHRWKSFVNNESYISFLKKISNVWILQWTNLNWIKNLWNFTKL